MVDFNVDNRFDFVYVLLGSLSVKNTAELLQHFDSVARVLNEGGLYLLDWCVQYGRPWESEGGDSWTMVHDGITVKTTVTWKAISLVDQLFEETIILEVDDQGKKINLIGKDIKRAIYPQEFLCFVSNHKDFEFIGWWNNWDLSQPLAKATKIDRPITLLKRI